ncbi:hypothetical protein D0Z00_004322 [Geotrichum galactomycetum]|uniref:Uncharacterized protein n=1 Tax=Geotrichum galactomycetum TaxID=27317 RepID=A0ACB6UYT2_9ASCO|nr:hypothetical protein D0Z00_004322 [Geotrichum candidum]
MSAPIPSSDSQPKRNYDLNQISQAVDALDDDSFQRSSFALKRTRSLGLLDQFQVKPSTDLIGKASDYPHLAQQNSNIAALPQSTALPTQHQPQQDDNLFQYTNSPQETSADDYMSVSNLNPHKSPVSSSSSTASSVHHSPSLSPSSSISGTPDLTGVHDDSDLQYEPSRHVDYLSHDWKESDISACWRNIVSKRKDVANSARLENASWRTWTKAKYNLRTVSPESVNWLKDCDITWLYGPLYNQPANIYYNDPDAQDDTAVTKVAVAPVPGHKPILKKRTVSDKIFARQAGHSNTTKSPETSPEVPEQQQHQQQLQQKQAQSKPLLVKSASAKNIALALPQNNNSAGYDGGVSTYLRHHNYRHRPRHGQSDEKISRQINLQYRHMPGHLLNQSPRPSQTGLISSFSLNNSRNPSSTTVSVPQPPAERHIHFNDRVEQCIAIENYSDTSDSDMSDDSEDESAHRWGGRHGHTDSDSESDSDEENENEPGLFLMLRSSSSISLHQPEGLSKLKCTRSSNHSIALLPATTLKCPYDDLEDEQRRAEEANSVAYAMSHNTQTRKHIFSGYDYNSVYQSPAQSPSHSPSSSISSTNQNSTISVNAIADPSSILADVPTSVAMPSHLCAQLLANNEAAVLPPVSSSESPAVATETLAPVASLPETSGLSVQGSINQIGKSAGSSLRNELEDDNTSPGMTNKLNHAAHSAKDFARNLWPSGWKKSQDL